MKNLRVFFSLAVTLGLLALAGCSGSSRGPLNFANVFKDFPVRVNWVAFNPKALLLVVNVQPWDGWVKAEGWSFRPNDHTNRREMVFLNDVISGMDDTDGTANFVIRSSGWGDELDPLTPGVEFYFMLSVSDGIHTKVEVWMFTNGTMTAISRGVGDIQLGPEAQKAPGQWFYGTKVAEAVWTPDESQNASRFRTGTDSWSYVVGTTFAGPGVRTRGGTATINHEATFEQVLEQANLKLNDLYSPATKPAK